MTGWRRIGFGKRAESFPMVNGVIELKLGASGGISGSSIL